MMDINNIYNHLRSSETYGYAQGGSVKKNRRRQDTSGKYRDRVSGSGTLSTVADFTPIIGDAKADKEDYDTLPRLPNRLANRRKKPSNKIRRR